MLLVTTDTVPPTAGALLNHHIGSCAAALELLAACGHTEMGLRQYIYQLNSRLLEGTSTSAGHSHLPVEGGGIL